MKKQKLTKEQRKELAWEKYWKVKELVLKEGRKARELALKKGRKLTELALDKCLEECEKIDAEPDEIPEIIEQNGRKYKLIKSEK